MSRWHEFTISLIDKKISELIDEEKEFCTVLATIDLDEIMWFRETDPDEDGKNAKCTMLHFKNEDSLVVNHLYAEVKVIIKGK